MTARRARIAFFTNDLSNTYQARFRASVEASAARHGLDLLVLVGRQLHHPDAPVRVQNVLYSEWLDRTGLLGAVLLSGAIGTHAGEGGLARLCAELAPLPTFSIGLPIGGVPAVVIENRAGMRVAVEHLLGRHRCRRVAYIGGPPGNPEAGERFSGYEDALANVGLGVDPELVATGDFTTATGRDAMARILARGVEFDALAVANDDMAVGAVELLREQRIRIGENVLVTSFDDTPKARYTARPLTSVAQPTDQMADHAIQSLLTLHAGGSVAEVTRMDVQLVLRESCGCGYLARSTSMPPPANDREASLLEYLERNWERLLARIQPPAGATRELWQSWAPRLLDALAVEMRGRSGSFVRVVEDIAEESATAQLPVDAISRRISDLREEFLRAGLYGDAGLDLDKLWMRALGALSAVAMRIEGNAGLHVLSRANELRHVNERLSTALGPATVAAELAESLRRLGVRNAFFAMYLSESAELRPLLALSQGTELSLSGQPYPAAALLPASLAQREERAPLVVMALSFESELLGLLALDSDMEPFMSEALRSQLSASLKVSTLHARVLEETALRERLAHEQLLGEMAIAKRLQTALAPRRLEVPALEIAARMEPADQVGGDYYDVVAAPAGCWIGVGDVTGHGLLSGLVMLMIQSIVSTLVSTRPDASPSALVVDLNAVLYPNIRERLAQDEHATLMLLRYVADGTVTFAGAHEDILVYRKQSGRCELVPSEGLWLAVRPDIRKQTVDGTLTLAPGDLLVLYTDGVIEARNAQNEQFGLARLTRIVRERALDPVESILDQILAEARGWAPVQQDDVTCLVARYTGNDAN